MKRISPTTGSFGALSNPSFRIKENIILVNIERITADKVEIANPLNNFFSNIKNFKLPKY